MNEPRWLTTADVLKLHRMQVSEFGGPSEIRDPGLLKSAVIRPQQRYHYSEVRTIPGLAAAYAVALSANHPFIDGNKRVAFHALLLFLRLNGLRLEANNDDATAQMLALAANKIDEAALLAWVEMNAKPDTSVRFSLL